MPLRSAYGYGRCCWISNLSTKSFTGANFTQFTASAVSALMTPSGWSGPTTGQCQNLDADRQRMRGFELAQQHRNRIPLRAARRGLKRPRKFLDPSAGIPASATTHEENTASGEPAIGVVRVCRASLLNVKSNDENESSRPNMSSCSRASCSPAGSVEGSGPRVQAVRNVLRVSACFVYEQCSRADMTLQGSEASGGRRFRSGPTPLCISTCR